MNKKVLITGAARGIGREVARVFASNNYDVLINYNNSYDDACNLKKELEDNYHTKAYLYKCDVSHENEVKDLFLKIKNDVGKIDVLVNNAGIAIDNDLESKDAIEFMMVIEVNLLGTYLCSKYARGVLEKGAIVNVSSNQAFKPSYIESIDYDASKAGVISLTHSFASFYAPDIRVNAVAPGWVNTDMNRDLLPDFKLKEEKKILLERFANPEEIANVVFFLASEDASYVNNSIIRVDGGLI